MEKIKGRKASYHINGIRRLLGRERQIKVLSISYLIFCMGTLATSLFSCHKIQYYYINELDMYIKIIELDPYRNRVYLISHDDTDNLDYIDVSYRSPRTEAVTLAFPIEDETTVYLLDGFKNVIDWKSSKYSIKHIVDDLPMHPSLEDLNRYKDQEDSILYVIPTIKLELGPSDDDVKIWIEDRMVKWPVASGRK